MNIEITSITVITGQNGTDKAILHTTLPGPTWPYSDLATLTLEVARGKGAEYCGANFPGIPTTVVGVVVPLFP